MCIRDRLKGNKLHLLIFRHFLVLKDALDGLKPIKEMIGIQLVFKLRNVDSKVAKTIPLSSLVSPWNFFVTSVRLVTPFFLLGFVRVCMSA